MIGTNVKVSAAPSYRPSQVPSGSCGLLPTADLVADDAHGVMAWCERPPSLSELTRDGACSFILPTDWIAIN